MNDYYYGAQDTAYSQWSESESKAWLVEHGIIKSDAQIKKDKLQKLVADNYATAHDTVYGGMSRSTNQIGLSRHLVLIDFSRLEGLGHA